MQTFTESTLKCHFGNQRQILEFLDREDFSISTTRSFSAFNCSTNNNARRIPSHINLPLYFNTLRTLYFFQHMLYFVSAYALFFSAYALFYSAYALFYSADALFFKAYALFF